MSEPKPPKRRPPGPTVWDKLRQRLEDLGERLFPSPEPELQPIPVRRR